MASPNLTAAASSSVKRQDRQKTSRRPVIMAGEAGLLRIIEQSVFDRHVEPPKLKHLLEMHSDLIRSRARSSFILALGRMQTDLPILSERGSILLKDGRTYTYALWEDIGEIITPILTRHGFALSFRIGRSNDGIEVTGVLGHKDGYVEETSMHLPADFTGNKNAVQAIGSSVSYGKRYVAQALLNLVSRGEDDDGRGGQVGTPIGAAELAELEALIERTQADRERLLAYLEIERLDQLPADRFEAARTALLVREGVR